MPKWMLLTRKEMTTSANDSTMSMRGSKKVSFKTPLSSFIPSTLSSPHCGANPADLYPFLCSSCIALPQDAAWWKSTLVSVCMMRASEWVSNPPPTPLLHATLERRKALLKAYGDELLASQPFQLLFRGSLSEEDQAIREERTREVLEEAAHQFTSLQGDMFGNLVVELLPELPTFDRHAKNMDHHILHVGFMPHHGARVLIVTRPHYSYHGIVATNGWQSRPPLQIVTARVLTAPKGPKARARWAAAGDKPIYVVQGHTNTAEKEGVNQEEAVDEGSDGEYKPRKLRRTYLRGAEDE
ncbi:uncharacterized protein AKAW2_51911A [Aspergillus luchuensis]|uniref:Uncharacterized protein n=1 Tax=Aspergillus kawachii TaxID=1069201 RepID=A0A7R8A1Z8_ASPKA|nr:uncharacterized protein AKAW2_51911A [Aspergillus luchuensis]BCS01570.1 hypothetical protein AKAW2_51911A [Aspergillus luchuensis]